MRLWIFFRALAAILLAMAGHAAMAMAAAPPDMAAGGSGLAALYRTMVAANPSLRAAQEGTQAAIFSLSDAYLGFAARANMVFDTSREDLNVIASKNPVYAVGNHNFPNQGNTLEVVQPLFDARIFAQLHQAYSSLHRSEQEADAARQTALFNLIESYLQALGAADAVRLAQTEQSTLEAHLRDVDLRMRRGMASDSDLNEVRTRLEQIRADQAGAEAALRDAFASLQRTTAAPVDAIVPLADGIPLPLPVPLTAQDWVQVAEKENPSLRATRSAVNEAQAVVETGAAADLPRVELRYTRSYLNSGGTLYGGGALTNDSTLLLRVTVPLFNPDGNGYPAVAAYARYQQQHYRAQDEMLELDEKTRVAFDQVVGNARRAGALERATVAADHVAIALRRRYDSGMETIIDVLEAERDALHTRRNLLSSRYNYLLNMMQLKRLAGQISQTDIAFLDSELDYHGTWRVSGAGIETVSGQKLGNSQ